jgi:hypothetical protein
MVGYHADTFQHHDAAPEFAPARELAQDGIVECGGFE